MAKMIFDEMDEKYENVDFEELFDNEYANEEYLVRGIAQRWDGSGCGHVDKKPFPSILKAIWGATEEWGICFVRVYEEKYGKLMLDVVHHDGTNHLEIREISKKGREVIDNDYGYIDKAVWKKGCTKNVKFTKKYY